MVEKALMSSSFRRPSVVKMAPDEVAGSVVLLEASAAVVDQVAEVAGAERDPVLAVGVDPDPDCPAR
jgi:hypothetical protein